MDRKIFADVDDYIADLFVKDADIYESVLANIDKAGIPRWNISANQGTFLQVLARVCNAKRILELGTQGGYSTVWLAKALPADGRLVTLEINPEFAAAARQNMVLAGVNSVVEVRTGMALDILDDMITAHVEPFDMVFIDADKPPYTEYLDCAIKLSRPGTLIVADNVVREGKVLDNNSDDPAVKGVQRFNKALAADSRVVATVIQNVGAKDHDGMAIVVVK